MASRNVRNVILDETDQAIIERVSRERGYGARGFSNALRLIVKEWAFYQRVVKLETLPTPDGADPVTLVTIRAVRNG